MKIPESIRYFARNKFAWPGGYPMLLLMEDSGILCHECLCENYKAIGHATVNNLPSDWNAAGAVIHWEGAPEICDNCGAEIPSAYGENDNENA